MYYLDRFCKVVSDPLNEKIIRHELAGKNVLFKDVECTVMHNGVKVVKDCYYGEFSKILNFNKGVHEPSEEYVFEEILKKINKPNPVMYELGSYWCFYSLSFLRVHPKGIVTCIEESKNEFQVGQKNMELNDCSATFINAKVGLSENNWSVDQDCNYTEIDILHSDIQGHEHEMLLGASKHLDLRLINFLFISTHSQSIHLSCLSFLREKKYHIVAEVDFVNTFCEDGIIIAQNPDMKELIYYTLPHTSNTQIITSSDFLETYTKLS